MVQRSTVLQCGALAGSFSAHPVVASAAVISALSTNMAYLNVHTVANPAGEIRGQFAGVCLVDFIESRRLW
jgi:hypothetical protein